MYGVSWRDPAPMKRPTAETWPPRSWLATRIPLESVETWTGDRVGGGISWGSGMLGNFSFMDVSGSKRPWATRHMSGGSDEGLAAAA